MIILDTHIVSELMKQSPSTYVTTWLNEQKSSELFITSITIGEISYGLNALPKGNRRTLLENAFIDAINGAFKHRILSFDEKAAYKYGDLMAHKKSQGRALSICDGEIAAITQVYNYKIATRNIKDFLDCNIELINPFLDYATK